MVVFKIGMPFTHGNLWILSIFFPSPKKSIWQSMKNMYVDM